MNISENIYQKMANMSGALSKKLNREKNPDKDPCIQKILKIAEVKKGDTDKLNLFLHWIEGYEGNKLGTEKNK